MIWLKICLIFDMDYILRYCSVVLLSTILILVVRQHNREFALVLSLLTCCMIIAGALRFLEPVFALIKRLQTLGNMDPMMTGILLKTVAIGMLGEIVCLICADTGNGVLSKTVQILSCAAVLYLSLPILSKLLDLLEEILAKA